MDLGLKGTVAAVVGGARGIGLAIARGFAQEGADVALVDRAPELTDAAALLTKEQGIRAKPYPGDVVDFQTTQRIAAAIRADLGRIDHLIFAVAIGSGKFGFPFWNLQPSDWNRVLEINILGAVNVMHAFAPIFVEAKSGSILLIASVAGQMGSQTDPPYSASKAAVINFMQCAAKDLAPHGVRVNVLNPGMVQTTLNKGVWEAWNRQQPAEQRKSYEEWTAEKIQKVVPLNRWQTPEDMAQMAVFLASERARNVCGQCVNVDGGFVMHW